MFPQIINLTIEQEKKKIHDGTAKRGVFAVAGCALSCTGPGPLEMPW